MKSLRRMFRFVKPYRWQVALALLLLVGMTASDLLIPRLTQRLIDDGVAQGNMSVVGTTALLMLAASLVSALCAVGNTIFAVRVGQDLRPATPSGDGGAMTQEYGAHPGRR